MKVYLYISILLIVFLSCSTIKQEKPKQISNKELETIDVWTTQYKNTTFQRCLFLGYKRSDDILSVLKKDNSGPNDFPFGVHQYRYIDTIVQPIIRKAELDSMVFYKKYLNGLPEIMISDMNGIPLMECCLDFYSSDKLDSIAESRVKQMNQLWRS